MSSTNKNGADGADSDDGDWEYHALDIAPGMITCGDPARRRLLEEVGGADNPRVRFIGAAAKTGGNDE